MLDSLLKYKINDTDEQPGEEIHRAKSGRVHSAEILSLWSYGAHPPIHQPRISPHPRV